MKQSSTMKSLATSLLILPILLQPVQGFSQQLATRSTSPLWTSTMRKSLPSSRVSSHQPGTLFMVAKVTESDEKQDEKSKEPPKSSPKIAILDNPVSKFRKLKDIMWIREAVEDLTAAEFACSVESELQVSDRKQKRAVDYEKLISQLNRRIADLLCLPGEEINGSLPELEENSGMGRFVYTKDQRNALLK